MSVMLKIVLAVMCLSVASASSCDYSKYATCGQSYSSCVQSNPASYCDCFGPYATCVSGAGCDDSPIISACKAAGCTSCPSSATEACDQSLKDACIDAFQSCVQVDPIGICACFPDFISCVSGAGCPDADIINACQQRNCVTCSA